MEIASAKGAGTAVDVWHARAGVAVSADQIAGAIGDARSRGIAEFFVRGIRGAVFSGGAD